MPQGGFRVEPFWGRDPRRNVVLGREAWALGSEW